MRGKGRTLDGMKDEHRLRGEGAGDDGERPMIGEARRSSDYDRVGCTGGNADDIGDT